MTRPLADANGRVRLPRPVRLSGSAGTRASRTQSAVRTPGDRRPLARRVGVTTDVPGIFLPPAEHGCWKETIVPRRRRACQGECRVDKACAAMADWGSF